MGYRVFEEEQEPEALKRKWDAEDASNCAPQICKSCGHEVAGDAFFCLFCGERVFEKSGLLGKIVFFMKQGYLIWIVLVLVLACFFLFAF